MVGSLLSNAIGMKLPGPGTIYIEQDLKFKKPGYIGETVTASLEVSEVINEAKGIIKLLTQVKNQTNELVIDGYAIVKAPARA